MAQSTLDVAIFSNSQDYIAARRTTTRGSKDYWERCQEVVFEIAQYRFEETVRRSTLLTIFYEVLLACARRGDAGATRELNVIARYLDLQSALAQPRPRSQGSLDMERRIARQAEITRLATFYLSIARFQISQRLYHDYEKRFKCAPDFVIQLPYYVDPVEAEGWIRKFLKIASRNRPGKADVGYAKPPIGTRWIAGQSGNPSGKRKTQEDDGWRSFRDGLFKNIPVLKEGRRIKLTSAAVICRRLFELAIKGDVLARREVRKLLLELDRRGLMVPPASRPRRRRCRPMCHEARTSAVHRIVYTLSELQVQQDLREVFARVYGPDPDFDRTIERKRKAAMAELASLNPAKGEVH